MQSSQNQRGVVCVAVAEVNVSPHCGRGCGRGGSCGRPAVACGRAGCGCGRTGGGGGGGGGGARLRVCGAGVGARRPVAHAASPLASYRVERAAALLAQGARQQLEGGADVVAVSVREAGGRAGRGVATGSGRHHDWLRVRRVADDGGSNVVVVRAVGGRAGGRRRLAGPAVPARPRRRDAPPATGAAA